VAAPTSPTSTTSTVIPVAGMTCRSCEVRIERNIRRLPGVERVSASAVHARVEIVSSGRVPAAEIARAIEAAGYEVGRTPWFERDVRVWATAVAGLLVLALIAVGAQVTGVAGLAAGAGNLAKGGVVVALLLGLAAGVSTCMALVGGLVLALSASFESQRPNLAGARGLAGHMRPSLVFMGGRIGGYAVLGAALGALGSSVTLPTQLIAVLMITVALVMTIVGTRLTGLSPRIAAWSPTLPGGLGRRLGLDGGSVGAYSDARAAGLGVASFFLPCGFTQAVQIYALSTGSPIAAGVIMGVFAVGTAPGLLALAGLPVIVPNRARPVLLRLIGVVVLGFAVVNAGAGLRLAGLTLPSLDPAPVAAAPLPLAVEPGDAQDVYTSQDGNGYHPGNVSLYAGVPTRWNILSLTSATCAAFVRVPSLGLAFNLREGLNTVSLPPLKAGTISYTCAMGMYSGTLTVVDRQTGALPGVSGGG
jgi:sulfite exporter TauE/SafE/copper chaperone CopZ